MSTNYRWGMVVGKDPLMVEMDGEQGIAVPVASTIVGGLILGDRVWCAFTSGQSERRSDSTVTIIGRAGGERTVEPGEPIRWKDWTPRLLATTDPVPGNSTVVGRYRHAADGTVDFTALFILGSTFNPGSGNWSMTLPVPSVSAVEWIVNVHVVSSAALGGNAEGLGDGKIEADGSIVTRMYVRRNNAEGAASLQTLRGSMTWAEGNKIVVTGTYEGKPAVEPWTANLTAPAIYIIPHQDDEILTMGAAIMEDVARGRPVYAVLCTRGEKSGVRTSTALRNRIGYTPSEREFSAQRDKEFTATVERMGATPIVPTWEERMSDGAATTAGIKALVKAKAPSGGVVAGCATTDYATDHQRTGQAAIELRNEGWATACRNFLSAPRRVTHAPPGVVMQRTGWDTPVTQYHQNYYRYSNVSEGWWGIGYLSVSGSFNAQLEDPLAYYHVPA